MLGLSASVFHLGRPLLAYRAILGLRTSWLSREILAFGVFAAAAGGYSLVAALDWAGCGTAALWQQVPGAVVVAAGIAAVMCSVMIYVDTRRPLWTAFNTSARFLLTTLLLGLPAALLVSLTTAVFSSGVAVNAIMSPAGSVLCQLIVMTAVVKLIVELSVFTHLRSLQHTPHKRSALLQCGALGMTSFRRFFFGVAGGVVLPLQLLAVTSGDGFHPLFPFFMSVLMLGLLVAGELHERYLFFAASVAPRMPGGRAA